MIHAHIKITYNEQTCLNCERVGDFRALPMDCHSHPYMGHGESDSVLKQKPSRFALGGPDQ
jgi:hypothetical protein